MFLEAQSAVQRVQKERDSCTEKEAVLKKDLQFARRYKKGGDVRLAEEKLGEVRRLADLYEVKLQVSFFCFLFACEVV